MSIQSQKFNIITMLRLQRLKIVGFKDSKKTVSVDFSPASISVIYGDNGSGKTTFLKVISAFLSQNDSALAALGVRAIECSYIYNGATSTITVKRAEISYDWSELVGSPLKDARSISLGVERGISTQSLRIESAVIYEFFRRSPRTRYLFDKDAEISPRELAEDLTMHIRRRQNALRGRADEIDETRAHQNLENIKLENIERLLLSHYRRARYAANLKIQSALFNTLSDAINGAESQAFSVPFDIYPSIIEYRSRLIEALTDEDATEGNQFKATIVKILGSLTESNFPSEIENKPLLGALFVNMIEELEKEKLALGAINLLVDTFNKYLIDNKKLVVSGTEIYVSIGDAQHSIHDLSSGERHILTFLSLVLFQGQDRDFLIIDEPEISLNITWQRQLLELFANLVPRTQIIVASHSPVLSKRHPEFLTPLRAYSEPQL
ncbi:ABC-type cobalamin/Fe3+-siderophores transport system ATPase subunit [Paraburkholderia sp. GAS199]|uniref:ATP-binding protein n=1 Tax=Paraburkholderia sp. GAS199 TaxID=3035126 RepID=UPI003D24E7F4